MGIYYVYKYYKHVINMSIKDVIIIGDHLIIINIRKGTVEGIISAGGVIVYVDTDISKLLPTGSETSLVTGRMLLEIKDIYNKLINIEKEFDKALNCKFGCKDINTEKQLLKIKPIIIEAKKMFMELAFCKNILKNFYLSVGDKAKAKDHKALVSKRFTEIAIDIIRRKAINDRLDLIKVGMVLN